MNCEVCGRYSDVVALDPNKGLIWVCEDCAGAMYDNSPPLETVLDAIHAGEVFRNE